MVLLLFYWIHSPWRNHCVLHERLASLATPLGTINEGALNPHDYVLAMKKKTKGLAKIIVNAFNMFLLTVVYLHLALFLSAFLFAWYTRDFPTTAWGWNQVLRN